LKLVKRTRETLKQVLHNPRVTRWGWLWPTLVIAVLSLLAAQPLLQPGITCSHDGSLHFLRIVENDYMIRHGHLYPRWAPDMAYGYGYPLFNFYAPLSWYVAEAFCLVGLSFVTAWNGTMALCLLACGLCTYLLARDWMPEHGALVAATAYLLAPYTLYDVFFRGNLAESVALPLLPLVLWAFGRLVRSGQARYLSLAAMSLALLLLAHQVMALLFGPVLAIYVFFLWWRRRRAPWRLLTIFTAGALALGLSAFFWMPAFLEKDTVHIERSFTPGGMNFRHNFITPGELFSPPAPASLELMNPSPPRSLSLAALALGLLGLLPLVLRLGNRFWHRFKAAFPIFAYDVSTEVHRAWHLFTIGAGPSSQPMSNRPTHSSIHPSVHQSFTLPPISHHERRQLGLLAGVLGLSFLMLSWSLPLWERLPLFYFAQFPWRFLGPASLLTALLAGNSLSLWFAAGPRRWPSRLAKPFVTLSAGRSWQSLVATAAAVALLCAFSLRWLYPRDCGQPAATIAAIPRFEQQTGVIGTTSAGEYLPRYVQEMPDPNALAAMYETGGPVVRLDPALLPAGATVELAEYGLTSARLLIRSPQPFRAVYRAFYFPGWRVTINGRNVPIVITAPHGLISFDVPAGQAAVQVWFGTTPLRLGSAFLSGASLLMVLWLAWQGRREGGFAPASALVAVRWWQWLILVALAGGLLWVKIAVVDAGGTWFRPAVFDGQTLQEVDVPLGVNLDDELTLLGYNLPWQSVAAGQSIWVELFWAAPRQPSAAYAFNVRLVDEQGIEWSPKGTRRPGGFHGFGDTQSWQPGEYARDVHLVDVLPGTPPGSYTLRVTAFEQETQVGLDVLNEQGVPIGQSVAVATITIAQPDRPPDPQDLDVTCRLDAPLGDLTLLGFSPGRVWAAPGDPMQLTTFWRAERSPGSTYTVQADLVNSLGQSAATLTFVPGAPQHATHRWQPGEVVRDQQVWVIPYHVPPGHYEIHFRAQDGEGQTYGAIWLPEHKLEIVAPERQMDMPTMQHKVEANLGDQATLLGYDLSPALPRPGEVVRLTLYWRAEQEIHRSYKVFVHLLDAEGRVRAQHDAVPANWTRPTTGWYPGEFVTDVHELAIDADAPPGEYLLEVGLYEEQSGIRLPLLDGGGQIVDERVVLEMVEVENVN
jgi:hypothetical protein